MEHAGSPTPPLNIIAVMSIVLRFPGIFRTGYRVRIWVPEYPSTGSDHQL